MKIRRFQKEDLEEWDNLVEKSNNGTFLHTRRFLNYHGDRFQDVSLIIEDDRKEIIGVLPAAIDIDVGDRVVSHPGITYGGIVHAGQIRGMALIETLKLICDTYKDEGFHTLWYKSIPYIYHRGPCSDDIYAFFRLNARLYRCDLSASIDLKNNFYRPHNRSYCLKKAKRSGITIDRGFQYIEPLWRVLEDHLANKYNAKPVHTVDEIKQLHTLFSNEIECVVGILNDAVVAGAILFKTHTTTHMQYSAASSEGYKLCATDLIYDYCINRSIDDGYQYFDFGTSNEQGGTYLNEGLYNYKVQYGAGGVAHQSFELCF
jgi:hypothetical protein